jgi:hypothetical protein
MLQNMQLEQYSIKKMITVINKHPINFYLKTLTPAEHNYDIHDQELLAVVRAFEEWRHYLEGSLHEVLIKSDHQNLTYWRKPQKINR